jgi:predicted ATP-dependent protease
LQEDVAEHRRHQVEDAKLETENSQLKKRVAELLHTPEQQVQMLMGRLAQSEKEKEVLSEANTKLVKKLAEVEAANPELQRQSKDCKPYRQTGVLIHLRYFRNQYERGCRTRSKEIIDNGNFAAHSADFVAIVNLFRERYLEKKDGPFFASMFGINLRQFLGSAGFLKLGSLQKSTFRIAMLDMYATMGGRGASWSVALKNQLSPEAVKEASDFKEIHDRCLRKWGAAHLRYDTELVAIRDFEEDPFVKKSIPEIQALVGEAQKWGGG